MTLLPHVQSQISVVEFKLKVGFFMIAGGVIYMLEISGTILGILASLLSIGSLLYSKKNSDRITKIENIINQNFQVNFDTSKKSLFSSQKASSGDGGNAIVGNNNSISQGDKK